MILSSAINKSLNLPKQVVDNLDSVLDAFHSGNLVVTSKREISFSNQYIVDKLGWKKDELLGRSLRDVFTKASKIFIDSYVYPLLIHERSVEELQLTMMTAEGGRVSVVANIKLDENQTTYWSLYDCANRDKLYQELIKAKELLEKQSLELIELATIDSLTGLLNRRELNNRVQPMLSQASRTASSVATIIIDIDFFKNVNDTYGHAFGDEVLQHISKMLLKNRREHDIVARFGGEEFVLVLPNITADNAFKVAEALRLQVEGSEIKGVKVTVSIGISMNKDDENNFDSLFKLADTALYQAKENGRNMTVVSKSSR